MKNNLAYRFPEIAKEWHPTKNGELKPSEVTYGSNRKAWWLGACGHEWDASIKERVRGYGCPICAGKRVVVGINDLESNYPDISKEWDYERNKPLRPIDVTSKSHVTVWWVCKEGHQYQSSVDNRTRGRGCPTCGSKTVLAGKNDLQSQNPFLVTEYSSRNTEGADAVFANSHRKVWWKCSQCGHEWQASVYSRNAGNGCPACAQRTQSSFPEQAVFYYIKQMYPDAINRCVPILGCRFELDIYIPSLRIGIEYDGKHWHENSVASSREKRKYEICVEKEISLIRITDGQGKSKNNCDFTISTREGLDKAIKELGAFFDMPEDINTQRDRFSIMECYIRSNRENSLAIKRPGLVKEWNYERNGTLLPEMFSEYSMFKVWWKCQKGHEWESTIAHRTGMGANCPICSNRKVLAGYNDVATTNPEILAEWDYSNNVYLPSELTAGSTKKVWWKCKKNHSWSASIGARMRGNSCPVCSGHKVQVGANDLATTNPKIAKEWNYEKNAPLTPKMISFGSNKKVWWKCEKGHEWPSMVLSRSKGNGCPFCSGRYVIRGETDIATTHPSLLQEWDYEKNAPLLPTEVTRGSNKRAFWKCTICGHEWKAMISDRTKGHGCPKCARNGRTK